MAVRPPRPRRPRRPAGRLRDLVVVATASLLLILFGLRVSLAALKIETWTIGWRLVAVPTKPLVAPLNSIDLLSRTPIGRLTLAEFITGTILLILVLLLLSSLTIRRVQR